MDMFNDNILTEAVRELTSRFSQVAKKLQKVESAVSDIPTIPTPKTADRGKFLKVKANANEYMLDTIPNEVPAPTIADAGKVITVNASGQYELA